MAEVDKRMNEVFWQLATKQNVGRLRKMVFFESRLKESIEKGVSGAMSLIAPPIGVAAILGID